ncbi:helix-turn-helix family protein [[Clostridium] bifermentans ATCC 19299]|uniref:helix-turn-helix domain-containing protein n=1 Tax=Paraclostridium bifermentans TaxID=1490 RepID=UPI00038C7987|nr:helix-turn-helix transcriptional regulator [Paraclostridium bifermentans]EQK41516.1 helix-turn-helix family protein [[Clostridium] bifermentans ATCC 19299] [Paraclostridium bifermentans ATCC 19299]NYA10829.1 helix-turn-helix transcriptional regulator [Klebsiella pneumoniae]
MRIGDKLKQERLRKKLTQENVAGILNVSRQTISNWEVGRNYPDLESLVALSDLYNFSLDKLLREDSEMVKKISSDSKQASLFQKTLMSIILLSIISVLCLKFLDNKSIDTQLDTGDIVWSKLDSIDFNQIDTNTNKLKNELDDFLDKALKDETFKKYFRNVKVYTGKQNSASDINFDGTTPLNMDLYYSYPTNPEEVEYKGSGGMLSKTKTKDGYSIYYEITTSSEYSIKYNNWYLISIAVGTVSVITIFISFSLSKTKKSN